MAVNQDHLNDYAISKQIPSIQTITTDYGDLPELSPDELARVRGLLTTIFYERKRGDYER